MNSIVDQLQLPGVLTGSVGCTELPLRTSQHLVSSLDFGSVPYLVAASVYQNEPCQRTFEEDLELHLMFGYVFSSPTMFMMGRAVEKDAPREKIVDPAFKFTNPDTWLIYLAAGDLMEFFSREPYPLPWVGWERDNKLRFYRMEAVKQRILR